MHFYWFSWTKIISINIKLCFFLQFFQFLQDLLLLFTYQSSYAHQTKKNFHFSNNFHTKNKLLINWYSKCTFLSIFFLQFVCIERIHLFRICHIKRLLIQNYHSDVQNEWKNHSMHSLNNNTLYFSSSFHHQ